MRLSLTLGDSEFLISNANVSGNCSTVELGWPDQPFPELGRIRMEFQEPGLTFYRIFSLTSVQKVDLKPLLNIFYFQILNFDNFRI